MAQFQPVIAPLTKNNAVIFFFVRARIFKFNWPTDRQVILRTCCAYAACIYFSFGCMFCSLRVYPDTSSDFFGRFTRETSTFYLQGTLQFVTVRRLLMLAYFSLIKLFMPDTQHTWPLFARFTCVNFDSAKSHSLNRYTNRYSNCYGECNCDLNCAVKEIQLNEKTEIAS